MQNPHMTGRYKNIAEPLSSGRVGEQEQTRGIPKMVPHTFQQAADTRIADSFMLVVALIMMIAPFVISVVANIGRRPWPSSRPEAVEVKPRARLAAPRVAA